MSDIFDIKGLFFGFLYSYQFFIGIVFVLFFLVYYLLLSQYLGFKKQGISSQKQEKSDTKENHILLKRFQYIYDNKDIFHRDIFYREVGLFLRKCIFEEYGYDKIFFMTGEEIKQKYPTKYQDIFQEIYLYEFDTSLEDSFSIRKNFLNQIAQKIKKHS